MTPLKVALPAVILDLVTVFTLRRCSAINGCWAKARVDRGTRIALGQNVQRNSNHSP